MNVRGMERREQLSGLERGYRFARNMRLVTKYGASPKACATRVPQQA